MTAPRLLRAKEVAAALGVSPRHFEAVIAPAIPRVNVARPGAARPAWRYTREALDAWMARAEATPGPAPIVVSTGTVLATTDHSVRVVYVYALHPLNDPAAVRYIGRTVEPESRLQSHRASRTLVGEWIREMDAKGEVIAMSVVEVITGIDHASRREAHWIRRYVAQGLADLNARMSQVVAA